jgi:hypothetical protein
MCRHRIIYPSAPASPSFYDQNLCRLQILAGGPTPDAAGKMTLLSDPPVVAYVSYQRLNISRFHALTHLLLCPCLAPFYNPPLSPASPQPLACHHPPGSYFPERRVSCHRACAQSRGMRGPRRCAGSLAAAAMSVSPSLLTPLRTFSSPLVHPSRQSSPPPPPAGQAAPAPCPCGFRGRCPPPRAGVRGPKAPFGSGSFPEGPVRPTLLPRRVSKK